MTKEEYIKLYEKLLNGKTSAEEEQLIYAFKDEFNLPVKEWNNELFGDKKATRKKIFNRLSVSINSPRKHSFFSFNRLAVAAIFIFLTGIAVFAILQYKKNNNEAVAYSDNKKAEEILPGTNKAILTLANGSVLVLDSLKNGTISQPGNIAITKTNGHISYKNQSNTTVQEKYNTLTIPKGGQYHLTLQDGTLVWLNAVSSLRFPVAFSNKTREVELTGEAYFEVAHVNNNGNSIPFLVHVKSQSSQKNMDVQVLGTHFNIMAYDDDDEAKTTLLQGSVKIMRDNTSVLLKPGEQAALKKNATDISVKKVDVDDAVAWKNGKFIFNKADIPAVMRQLARWYDVDVVYKGAVPKQQFWGGIERNLPLSSVLSILKESDLKFEVQNRQIIVSE